MCTLQILEEVSSNSDPITRREEVSTAPLGPREVEQGGSKGIPLPVGVRGCPSPDFTGGSEGK